IDRVASQGLDNRVKQILGFTLLLAAAAMVVKIVVQRHRRSTDELLQPSQIRPLPTLLIGVAGGFIVGMTSVGSGSLMIVMLMLLYPALTSREMVGTDLVQAIPLVGAAALGHLLFGHFQLDLATSVLVGAIPGVYLGAHVSARASDRYVRPALVAVLTISSLKLLNASNDVLLGATVAAVSVLLAMFVVMMRRKPVASTPVPELAPQAG
ncbi:MAG TPA: sulfite exporter TauE/SafE family protein, partial [Acidimicrobiia bacterium]|nr:sulfite exporter TauE/SafE family protein [Acidimicrobiia bacterium]